MMFVNEVCDVPGQQFGNSQEVSRTTLPLHLTLMDYVLCW